MEERLFGLTKDDVRSMAFQLAELNGLPHNRTSRMAGHDWFYGFLDRHPRVSLRKPEATSAARARGFNRIYMNGFFDLLEEEMKRHQFKPQNIYNVDETSFTAVQVKCQRF